jgi:GT2 family glycosyltransferase
VTDRRARMGVVLLTYDRRDSVVRTIERLRALPDALRLVAVDNGSPDHTADVLAERFPDLELVRLADNRGAAGRNAGVARLDTPYVAFCDDDTWWAPGMLDRAADLLDAHPALGLVTGTVLVEPGGRIDPTCGEMARSPLRAPAGLPGRPVLGFLCAASVVRREAFVDVGGFEPRFFLGGEEALLAIDLATRGWALAYVDQLIVHHAPSVRRETGRRRRLLLRNALWCAWLRRPLPAALRFTGALIRTRRRDPALVPALAAALAGSAWIAAHRRVVPPAVERGLRALDARRLGPTTPGRRPAAA